MSADRIKVKRDGPRGWHWIAAAHFDPAKHEIVADDTQPPKQAPQQLAEQQRKRGRPRKES